ncbi:MAG TPA: hypothetical protein VJU77_10315 [Chthoniobacterales bacterium]|nr:hypothetical protein [Chthoniobacterales bacterium]
MKFALILASICCALLLGGCADNSLMTDEEYAAARGPAPHQPDPTYHLPQTPNRPSGY